MKEDWIECSLGEISSKITKGSTPTTYGYKYQNQGINFIKIENVVKGRIELKSIHQFISEEAHNSQKRSQLKEGDVLFSIAGTIGETCLISKDVLPANTNQAFAIINGFNKVLIADFLRKQLDSFVSRKLKAKARGGAMNNVSLTDLKELNVVIPSLVEQKAIVKKIEELFSSLASGIADLKKAQEQLVIYRQAVLKKAFEGELTKEWREKQTNLPSADELLEKIKEERQKHYEQQLVDWKKAIRVWETNKKIGKKPVKPKPNKVSNSLNDQELENLFALSKQFKWVKIGEICSVKGGKRLPRGHKFAENKTEFIYIMAGNLKDGTVKNGLTYIYEDTYNELYRYTVNAGDVYITIVGACIGDAGIIPKAHNLSVLTENAAKIITTKSLSNKYLSFWLNSLIAQIRIKGSVFSATLGKLALSRIELLEIPICSKQEQHQIVQEIESRLSVCDKVEESITQSLEKAQALRQSILKKAFEGMLLSEAEVAKCKADKAYEPANVLLEKIKSDKNK